MSSRDVWSCGGGAAPRELICSCLASLLLSPPGQGTAWVCSPWISDFVLFDNQFRQVDGLFPTRADAPGILFSEYLADLSLRMTVRVVTARSDASRDLLAGPVLRNSAVEVRLIDGVFQREGILTSSFYIEGAMNLTASGLYVRGDKVTFHTPDDDSSRAKIAILAMEFERQWQNLGRAEATPRAALRGGGRS